MLKTPGHNWWLDIAICYEDATLFSREKKFNEKVHKYGSSGAGIVIGHSGCTYKKSEECLKRIGLSNKKIAKLLFTMGAIVLRHTARIVAAYQSEQ
ncbi:hypothetical protein ADUPG1_005019 [Aduncisulcus paluster]|uniref:Uncharacterized protein n=1 Tax=Aduncisulcus paluster TaxID=2918883 RepID=A0ABQ5K807_9EUKA|nr:hypothetical protein ADUPG1_005019 [Aduncisulcus paluster]